MDIRELEKLLCGLPYSSQLIFAEMKMIFGVLIFLCACMTGSFSLDFEEILKNRETFDKCMTHFCSNDALMEEEINCMKKLSEKDTEFLLKEAQECYGEHIKEINEKVSKGLCKDMEKAYECSKKCCEKFKELDRTEEEKAAVEQYKECLDPLYAPCLS